MKDKRREERRIYRKRKNERHKKRLHIYVSAASMTVKIQLRSEQEREEVLIIYSITTIFLTSKKERKGFTSSSARGEAGGRAEMESI